MFFFTKNGFLPRVTLESLTFAGSGSFTITRLFVIFTLPLSLGFADDEILIAGPFLIDSFPVTAATPPGEFKSRTAVSLTSITDGVLLPTAASSTYAFVNVEPAFNDTVPALASIIGAVGFVGTVVCEK